jgi:EmrB/QacA subfamily drug resistance transporter
MTPYLIYIAAHLFILLASINSSAVSVAFSKITDNFGASLVMAGWVLSIYQLVATVSMVLVGKIADIIGRKKTFLICAVLFVVGSALAALAPNIQLLIFARFIQSIGGGGFVPTVTGIIIDIFPNSRQKAIGFSMSVFNIGGVVGPSVGGWLLDSFGWQSIFWFNVPLGLLAAVPVIILLKSEKGGGKRAHIDFTGAGFFAGALFSLMIGLSQIGHAESGVGWMTVGLLFIAFIVLVVVFIRHELKSKEPIVDLDLLRLRPFAASNIYNFLFGACVFGFSSFIPLYAMKVYAMSTIQSSLVLSFRAGGMIVTAIAGSFFLIRWGYRWPMLIGAIMISVSLLFMGIEPQGVSVLGLQLSSVAVISAIALLFGLGLGIASPASSNACLDLIPTRAATLTGVRGMFRQSGGAISIAMTTLLLQFIGNYAQGFSIIFISMAALTLVTIPFVFAMPARADTRPVSGNTAA